MDRINTVLSLEPGQRPDVMNVHVPLGNLAIYFGENRAADRALASVVQNALLPCRGAPLIGVDNY